METIDTIEEKFKVKFGEVWNKAHNPEFVDSDTLSYGLWQWIADLIDQVERETRENIKEDMRRVLNKYRHIHLRPYFDDFNRLHGTKSNNTLE